MHLNALPLGVQHSLVNLTLSLTGIRMDLFSRLGS